MIQLSYADLDQMIEDGLAAFDYAWEHYEELNARKAVYTLYGPSWGGIGAASPSHLTYPSARKLTTKTRRKDYNIYELDEQYQLLRVKNLFSGKLDATFHLFELNGATYARGFCCDGKRFYTSAMDAIWFRNGKPYSYANISKNSVVADFFEYTSPGMMTVTHYLYYPNSQYRASGHLISWDAPMGAPNSPVGIGVVERKEVYIPFSEWFK